MEANNPLKFHEHDIVTLTLTGTIVSKHGNQASTIEFTDLEEEGSVLMTVKDCDLELVERAIPVQSFAADDEFSKYQTELAKTYVLSKQTRFLIEKAWRAGWQSHKDSPR